MSKIAVGAISDRQQRRRPWVIAGYALSSLVRPLIGLAGSWAHVLALRCVDRLGKGVRGAPRDALLAQWAPADARGRVFGFHRAMDHTGAVIGPLMAAAFLWQWPDAYRTLFAWTLVPGLMVIALTLGLPRDRPSADASARSATHATGVSFAALPGPLLRVLGVLALFTLGNSTDAYLLLRLGELTGTPALVPFAWSALHVVKVGTSLAGGALSDRVGRRALVAVGWAIYAAVYGTFALAEDVRILGVAFLVYGASFGLTEGVEKAWIADLAPASLRGTAFGLYNGVLGFGGLAASLLFGAVWSGLGAPAAFLVGATLAAVAIPLLWVAVPGRYTR